MSFIAQRHPAKATHGALDLNSVRSCKNPLRHKPSQVGSWLDLVGVLQIVDKNIGGP